MKLDFLEILKVFMDKNFISIFAFKEFNKTSVKIDKLNIIKRYE